MNVEPQTALQLRNIHLPGAAAFWPPAPGWWLVALVALLLLGWGAVVAWRRYRIHRQRNRVLAALAELESGLGRERTPEVLARISILLRRLALMQFPRERVAPLTGRTWLAFLDESGGGDGFCHGPGQVLASGPYQRSLARDVDVGGLSSLVRAWVTKNTGVLR
ncbi:MAG: DUF4381 domain-containing protein [Burkholderiales bacterium]|nr:DUF4381 domain-containing protein [Burkholderiales bacterium]